MNGHQPDYEDESESEESLSTDEESEMSKDVGSSSDQETDNTIFDRMIATAYSTYQDDRDRLISIFVKEGVRQVKADKLANQYLPPKYRQTLCN